MTNIIAEHTSEGHAGGTNIVNIPATTPLVREAAPGLIVNEVDSRVAQIKPMATPVDQISRLIGARRSKSMIVDYYSVDSKAIGATMTGTLTDTGVNHSSGRRIYEMGTDNNNLFAESDTLLVPGVEGKSDSAGGVIPSLILYVLGVNATEGKIKVIAINYGEDGVLPNSIANCRVVRMGRAAGELDVQTAQFEALPVKSTNYCQIFKAQVEQSSYMRQSAKEVGWTFSDQEEIAVTDMRMSMEKSFLFGCKARIPVPERADEILFTGGIWNQAGSEWSYAQGKLTNTTIVDMMRVAFSGGAAGSGKKILFAGSGLISELSRIEHARVLLAGDKTTRWGVDFTEVTSKFGTLMVVRAEVFDQCGHEYDGLIVDPTYMSKYVHVPFKAEKIDMKRNGTRNTEALVITEASCLVLRNPLAHVRIIESTGANG